MERRRVYFNEYNVLMDNTIYWEVEEASYLRIISKKNEFYKEMLEKKLNRKYA